MHQPPIPHVAGTDPDIAELIQAEARRQRDKVRLIPSENYVSVAVLEATRDRADEQVLRGLPGPALLRGPAVHRPDRADRGRARRASCSASSTPTSSRTRARPRTSPSTSPSVARRHGDGHGAADGRPPDARLAGVGHGQVVQGGAVRRAGRHRPRRPRRGARARHSGAAQADLLRRHGHPAHHRLPGVRGDRAARSGRSWSPTSRTSPASSRAARTRRRSGTPT